jgi:hypothetical protein
MLAWGFFLKTNFRRYVSVGCAAGVIRRVSISGGLMCVMSL